MDTLDQKLVTLLRHDARRSISALALDLGVSRATVRARIARLERAGDIIGYTVILRADALEQAVRGMMMIESRVMPRTGSSARSAALRRSPPSTRPMAAGTSSWSSPHGA